MLLFIFFTVGATCGVKSFWENLLRPHMLQLAALAGRRRLCSPASLSRALSGVEFELLREVSDWLLVGIGEIDAVMGHPASRTRDALGQD